MTIVYTGTDIKHIHSISAFGLPKDSFVATHPYIAEYYKRLHGKGGVIAKLDIPNVMKYSIVTDKYKIGKSLQLKVKPPKQKLIKIGYTEYDFK